MSPSPAPRWTEHTVAPAEAGQTVEEILRGPLGVSGRRIQKLTRGRGILLNRRPAFLRRKTRAGDVVAVRVAGDESPALPPVPMALDVPYEDAELLVVNKAPGLLVHPTSPTQRATLAHGVAARFAEQGIRASVRPVHRLDRDTSGLVLFAKSAAAHARLDSQLREGAVQREYLALAGGVVRDDEGVIDAPIGPHPRHRHLRAVCTDGGSPARTRFTVVERFAGATLLRLELQTGRTHQIRVHLAHLGHPVLGDRQYGGAARLTRQALHAGALRFLQPSSQEPVEVSAPLPADMAALLEALRQQRPSVGTTDPLGSTTP